MTCHSTRGAPREAATSWARTVFAGAGFPFNEERALEGNGGVDGDFEVAGGDVAGGGLEGGTGEYSEWRYWEFEGCGVKGRIRSVAKDA